MNIKKFYNFISYKKCKDVLCLELLTEHNAL